MKMEMSYRDKLVLLVVAIIVILVGGFFALVKPKYTKLKEHKATYDTTYAEWSAIQDEINQIKGLQDNIKKVSAKAKDTAKIFVNTAFKSANSTYNSDKTPYELDQYLQPAIDESAIKVNAMDLGGTTAKRIEYFYHTPNVLTYSLLEAADVNGNYAADVAEVLKENIVLSARETADVMAFEVNMTVTGTKENLMVFLQKIADDKNAILVEALDISDYKFWGGLELDEVTKEPLVEDTDGIGTSEMNLTVSFYNAKVLDEPELGPPGRESQSK